MMMMMMMMIIIINNGNRTESNSVWSIFTLDGLSKTRAACSLLNLFLLRCNILYFKNNGLIFIKPQLCTYPYNLLSTIKAASV